MIARDGIAGKKRYDVGVLDCAVEFKTLPFVVESLGAFAAVCWLDYFPDNCYRIRFVLLIKAVPTRE